MSKLNNQDKDQHSVANLSIPLWIKVMWILGIAWVIFYIIEGLKSTPVTW